MQQRLRRLGAGLRGALRGARSPGTAVPEGQVIQLDYPMHPAPRWGYGRAPHEQLHALIDANRAVYARHLESFLPFVDELAAISFDEAGAEPNWTNLYFRGLDAVSLYCFLAQRRSATYLEIGAGNSTRFARRAISLHGLPTRIVSIDPAPRAALRGLSDEYIDAPLEQVDQSVFDVLTGEDVVVLDGSHQSFMNSDVTVFFCELLPRLPSGLLLYVDDVFLPWDYPESWVDRWYSEQYLLAAWLLAGERLEVTLPNFWICTEPDLHRVLAPLWDRFTWAAVPTNGTGFWVTVR